MNWAGGRDSGIESGRAAQKSFDEGEMGAVYINWVG